MFSRFSWFAVSALWLLPIAAPASATTIYTWRSPDGSIMFSDDAKVAPPGVKVEVWGEVESKPAPPAKPEPIQEQPAPVAVVPDATPLQREVTQGEFAVRLAEELGLGEEPDLDEAAELLDDVRIAPRLGEWELDEPVTLELVDRLRQLTVAAAEQGRIPLTPEQGLLAFDTTVALLGAASPDTARSGERVGELSDTPPVYVVPLEVFPVVSGVFILEGDKSPGRHRHRHGAALKPNHGGRHSRDHGDRHPVFDPPRTPPPSPGSFAAPDRGRRQIVAPGSITPPQPIHRQPPPVRRVDRPPAPSSVQADRAATAQPGRGGAGQAPRRTLSLR